jgi:ankyrin repeat protein
MAEFLLAAGADINAPDNDGNTPLDGVLSNPDLDTNTRNEVAEYLRANGARTKQ